MIESESEAVAEATEREIIIIISFDLISSG